MRAADLLERREDRGAIDQLVDDGVTPRAFEAFSRRAVENDFGLVARRVDPFEACTGDAFAAQFDHIDADVICLVARRDDREMRDLPVWYRHLGSGQMARRHFGLDVLRARIAHPLGESDRTDAASVNNRRQQLLFLRFATGNHDCFGGEIDGGGERHRREHVTEFLGKQAQPVIPDARAAIGLGYGGTEPAHAGDLRP